METATHNSSLSCSPSQAIPVVIPGPQGQGGWASACESQPTGKYIIASLTGSIALGTPVSSMQQVT
uniref:Uncharacterized protein n=1 Tax=Anguilla anguilla TaxID=7936 RepID=A0A0E9WYA3_ANGAN